MKNLADRFGGHFALGVAFCLINLPSAYAAGATAQKMPTVTKMPQPVAVAFVVNGFSGCCIPKNVKKFLEEKGVKVKEANWNDLDQKRDPGSLIKVDQVTNNVDEYFIKQMQEAVKGIPETTPLIIIGHSFGGDAVLQVAKRIKPRRIAFLAVLDPVGRGGLRQNVTEPVPSNVDYFFNRWQQNPPLPLDVRVKNQHREKSNIMPIDSLQSGEVKSQAGKSSQEKQNTEKTSKCETKYRDPLKAIPQLLTHSELPNDSCIQHKIIGILQERLFH
jgi:hypothetical protein